MSKKEKPWVGQTNHTLDGVDPPRKTLLYTCIELFGIECEKGWESLYGPLIKLCNENNIKITQIKEKYGGLRFYVLGAPNWIWDKIDEAEKKSYTICELCGAPGELRGAVWYMTRCDKCNEKETAFDKDLKPEDGP